MSYITETKGKTILNDSMRVGCGLKPHKWLLMFSNFNQGGNLRTGDFHSFLLSGRTSFRKTTSNSMFDDPIDSVTGITKTSEHGALGDGSLGGFLKYEKIADGGIMRPKEFFEISLADSFDWQSFDVELANIESDIGHVKMREACSWGTDWQGLLGPGIIISYQYLSEPFCRPTNMRTVTFDVMDGQESNRSGEYVSGGREYLIRENAAFAEGLTNIGKRAPLK